LPAREQLLVGLELTITGMVTVFLLLAFMVLVISWMSKLAHRLQPVPGRKALAASRSPAETLDTTLVSVISAAVHRYRRSRR